MAEEFYTPICGGNWWSSPANAMFPGIGISSPCFADVSNLYLPVESAANGFSSSNLPYWNQTLLEDGGEVAELNSYASNLSEFSPQEDSSALARSFLFGTSDYPCSGRGTPADNINGRNQLVSSGDHFLNLERVSPLSFQKLRPNSKTSGINSTRPSNITATMESKVIGMRPSQAQQRLCSKLRNDGGGNKKDVNSSSKRSTNMVEAGLKRPRTVAPSPLPTFKVRKEKLGDRITALQQLVSPFGKTDTASVLHEAIDYIKFLHDQVHVLSSSSYTRNEHPHGFPRRELRSQGLCLVPVSSTFPVICEAPGDFWTPTGTIVGSNFK